MAALSLLLAATQAVFVPMPPVEETNPDFVRGLGLSGSGTVVAGDVVAIGAGGGLAQPFVWRGNLGSEALGLPAGAVSGSALAATDDGTTLAGLANLSNGEEVALRWTGTSPPEVLAIPRDSARITGLTGDGTYLVGYASSAGGDHEGFRLGPAGIDWLGIFPGWPGDNRAFAVSDDGQVVVGGSQLGQFPRAYVWSPGTGLTNLGVLGSAQSGLRFSTAYAVSGDGQVVGGVTTTPGGFVPFRWTSATGMVAVGPVTTLSAFAIVFGLNADGSRGAGVIDDPTDGFQAAYFEGAQQGIVLKDHALALGAPELDGWNLSTAFGISSDGNTIAGRGDDASSTLRSFVLYLDGDAAPELGTTTCPTNPNSAGSGARLRAVGSRLVEGNALRLHCDRLPSNQFVMFVNGTTTNNLPLGTAGDVLCVGGDIGRYSRPSEIKQANGMGAAALDLDLSDTPSAMGPFSVMAGQSLHFQAWYRDADPLPTFHLSNGTVVSFL